MWQPMIQGGGEIQSFLSSAYSPSTKPTMSQVNPLDTNQKVQLANIRWADFPGGQSITRMEKTHPTLHFDALGAYPTSEEVRIELAVVVDHANSLSFRSSTS